MKCKKCKNKIDWNETLESGEEIILQANHFGKESLSEHQQMLYDQEICYSCFQKLEEE